MSILSVNERRAPQSGKATAYMIMSPSIAGVLLLKETAGPCHVSHRDFFVICFRIKILRMVFEKRNSAEMKIQC